MRAAHIPFVVILVALNLFGFRIDAQTPPTPPNILFISCEDLSPHFSFYGDSTVSTPNLSRLAAEGIVYDNAFSTAGVCAPSRSAIITGMNQVSTGGHNMRTLTITYPEKNGLPKSYSIVPPPGVRAFPEFLRAAGYYCTNNEKTDYQFEAPVTAWDEISGKASWRGRKPNQPFFSVINLMVTHESQVWIRKNHPLHVDPAKIKVPPYYPDTKTVRNDMARFFSNVADLDSLVGGILGQLKADGLLDNTIIFFWSDHGDGLPFSKRELYDRGIRVPMVIRFPDKQRAGERDKRMISTIDLAPTVLSLAGIDAPSYMQGRAFLGSRASKQANEFVYAARDRMDSEYDRVRAVRDSRYKYIRNFRPELPLYQVVEFRLQQDLMREILELKDAGKLNDTQMKWFVPNKPEEELYDMASDPFEFNNLAKDPRYASHLKRMRDAFNEWQKQVPDLGSIPEKDLIKKMWNGGAQPPSTAEIVVSERTGLVTLSCSTEGASIGYKIYSSNHPEEAAWNVYTKPFRVAKGETLKAVAQRIGYTQSPVATKTF
jgi:N-sulfoglucosamine sulfohydrolase